MKRPSLALVAVFAVLGFMLAVAFNSNLRISDARPTRSLDLVGVVRDMERQRRELQTTLAQLRARKQAMEAAAAREEGARSDFQLKADQVRAYYGMTVVKGPGLEIVLGDASAVPDGQDANNYLIHDYDIRAVVNALMAGGAEAVSVNGERVVATTAVRCAGNTILVNGTRLAAPYNVLAVGDQAALERALQSDEPSALLFGDFKDEYSLQVSYERKRVKVPAYRGSARPEFAKPSRETTG